MVGAGSYYDAYTLCSVMYSFDVHVISNSWFLSLVLLRMLGQRSESHRRYVSVLVFQATRYVPLLGRPRIGEVRA